MIVDGAEVLYTIRNGKIVDPNIPMNGLVCYLDTRGKNNTDVYRNTLLDLSGNGNHGTLENFSFTESSGYSAGGLKFDGVDDKITPIPFDTTATDDYTAYLDFTLPDILPNDRADYIMWAPGDVFILYVTGRSHMLRYYVANLDGGSGHISTSENLQLGNRYKIIVAREGLIFKIFVDGVKIVEKTLSSKTKQTNGRLSIFKHLVLDEFNPSTLHKVALYNRALTDEEITKLMEVE